MTDGAIGLRERRMTQTSGALISTARRLTADRGLTGFTVEEICEPVGVSRRTFFNYFASKEDAVLGLPSRRDCLELEERFVAGGGAAAAPGGLSGSLLQDLADLAVARWEVTGITADDVAGIVAAFEREPRLLAKMLEVSRTQERDDVLLVERREHLAPGDLRAATAVQLMGAVMRASAEEFLTRPDGRHFHDVLTGRLEAARAVFSS